MISAYPSTCTMNDSFALNTSYSMVKAVIFLSVIGFSHWMRMVLPDFPVPLKTNGGGNVSIGSPISECKTKMEMHDHLIFSPHSCKLQHINAVWFAMTFVYKFVQSTKITN